MPGREPVLCRNPRSVRQSRPLRHTALIVVDDPAEHIYPPDRFGPWGPWERSRTLLTEALIGTPLIEEAHVVSEHPVQMAFAEDHEVVEALLPEASGFSTRGAEGVSAAVS